MSKHVLVIDGLRPLHEKIKNLGARLTLMRFANKIRSEDSELYDRIIGISNNATIEEWIDIAKTLHKIDPIESIGAYHEMNQDKASLIANELGLPFHSIQVIDNVRNKFNMREKLRKEGIDPTNSQKVKSVDEIEEFGDKFGYPLILKPLDGWASIGVSKIRNKNEIESAIKWFTEWGKGYDLYIEEYLDGKEYSVEALSENGEHKVICITEKLKNEEHFVELGHILPSKIEQEEQIKKFIVKVLEALEVENGGTHTEIILTNDGPRVVESHLRLGGDFIPELIELAYGIDLMELWARQTLGEEVLDNILIGPIVEKYSAIWFTSPNAIGTIEKIEGEDEAKKIKGVHRIGYFQKVGAQLRGVHDSFSRTAYVISSADSPETAIKVAQDAADKLKFIVSC